MSDKSDTKEKLRFLKEIERNVARKMKKKVESENKVPDDAVLDAVLPPLQVKNYEGRCFRVVLTDVEDLGKFWFNYFGDNHSIALQSLMKDLNAYYNSVEGPSYKVKNLPDLKIGCLLVARYKRGAYHRVVVKDLIPPDKVTLKYVDYGTRTNQYVSKCRYIIPRFTKLPAQAAKARLWGFTEKPGVNGKQIREEIRSLEFFDRSEGCIYAEVKSGLNVLEYDAVGSNHRLEARRGLALQLYDISYPNELEIGEILVKSGLAEKEIGEKIIFGEEPGQYYTKYVKDSNVLGRRVTQGDRDRAKDQHPASLTSRLEDGSNPVRAATSGVHEDDTNLKKLGKLGKIRKYIEEDAAVKSMKAVTVTDTTVKQIAKLDQVRKEIREYLEKN